MAEHYIQVGVLQKPTGTNGEIKAVIEDHFLEDFVASDHFFIKMNGTYVPYFIEDIRETNHILVKIEDINNPEEASSFNLKEIFLKEKNITSASFQKEQASLELQGFVLFDGMQEIGTIETIEIYPQQIMAWVNYQGKLVPVPLAEQLIEHIDHQNKSITMQLPEGILVSH